LGTIRRNRVLSAWVGVTSLAFLRDGGGATAWSVGGVGSDATPPEQTLHLIVNDKTYADVTELGRLFVNRENKGDLCAYK
jgi:hypothetical protein